MLRQSMVALLLVGVAGCGYSEDEWQAQLDKYNKLQQQCSADRTELDQQRARVADLESQLAAMGIKVKDMEEMRAALAQYKERAEALERIKARFESLRSKLQKLTNLGLQVSIRRNRMVISLPGDVLFASGSDKLRDDGMAILTKVAEVIRSDSALSTRHYQVAGHTDNRPLMNAAGTFKDNWGLSLMRSREVLVHLTRSVDDPKGGGSLDATHWSASGYGDTDPIAGNEDDGGRQKNRRVELILMPDVEEMLDLKSFL